MKNIVLIIPNIFKMFLISNYKLCQDPNTKNSKKNTSGEGNGSCEVCVRGEASSSIYSYGNNGLEEISMHALMQQSWGSH